MKPIFQLCASARRIARRRNLEPAAKGRILKTDYVLRILCEYVSNNL